MHNNAGNKSFSVAVLSQTLLTLENIICHSKKEPKEVCAFTTVTVIAKPEPYPSPHCNEYLLSLLIHTYILSALLTKPLLRSLSFSYMSVLRVEILFKREFVFGMDFQFFSSDCLLKLVIILHFLKSTLIGCCLLFWW